jgi:hypothetical protein
MFTICHYPLHSSNDMCPTFFFLSLTKGGKRKEKGSLFFFFFLPRSPQTSLSLGTLDPSLLRPALSHLLHTFNLSIEEFFSTTRRPFDLVFVLKEPRYRRDEGQMISSQEIKTLYLEEVRVVAMDGQDLVWPVKHVISTSHSG